MIKLAICDDDIIILTTILDLIQEYQELNSSLDLEIKGFSHPQDLFQALEDGEHYDICLLDIIMPGYNGIQVAKELRRSCPSCVIIFLTGTKDFAFDAFSVNAFQYLLKPVDMTTLSATLDSALARLQDDLLPYYTINTSSGIVRCPVSDIIFVEIRLHTLYFHMKNNEVVQSVTQRVPFEEAVAELLGSGFFIQPHQSYVVNMKYISRFERKEFETSDGNTIPIAKLRYHHVKDAYMMFLASKSNN